MLTGGSAAAWVTASAVSSMCLACGGGIGRKLPRPGCPASPLPSRQRSSSVSTLEVTQPSDSMPLDVVVDHEDQRVRLGPAVAEQAHGLVAVPESVRVHVAVRRDHGAHVLGPGGALDPALDQPERGAFGRGGLVRGAQAGDAGQQRQRRRALVLGRISDEALAEQFLQVGAAGLGAGLLLAPPGTEQFADHAVLRRAGCARRAVPALPGASPRTTRSAAGREAATAGVPGDGRTGRFQRGGSGGGPANSPAQFPRSAPSRARSAVSVRDFAASCSAGPGKRPPGTPRWLVAPFLRHGATGLLAREAAPGTPGGLRPGSFVTGPWP